MIKNIIGLLFLWITSFTIAQNSSELFAEANDFYKNGKYDQAIESYKKIIENGEVSSELYYNLGNCYYKINEVAPAIYNFEKALVINPSNENAKNNLVYASKLTLDRIEPLPQTFWNKIDNSIAKINFETWGVLAILCSIIASILFLLYYFSEITSKKRLFFMTSLINFLFLIVTFSIGLQQYNKSINTKFGIIFSKEVNVKNEPIQNAETSFTIHEGTKVKILDSVDNWNKIQLINGKTGWMLNKNLNVI